jgi:hypothetical protein
LPSIDRPNHAKFRVKSLQKFKLAADTSGMQSERTILDLLQALPATSGMAFDARRKELRIPQEPILVRIALDGGEFIPVIAELVNVSKSGIGLKTSRPLPIPPGTSLVVEIRSILITGTVRYCVPSRNPAGAYNVGLEITSIAGIQ